MRFYKKLLVMLSLTLLCLSFAGVFAQTTVVAIASVNSPTTSNLNSVFIVNNATNSPNDLTQLNAWAVGDSGVIAKWNGSSWATVNSPTTANLYSVFFINSTMGWAVGGNATNGVILTYNGTWSVWSPVNATTTNPQQVAINETLYSITMDGTGLNGYAVGANGIAFGLFNFTCFTIPSVTNATLRSVSMIHNSTDGWAVGDNGTILWYSNSTNAWTQLTSPTNATLYGIQMINSTMGWAVGGTTTNGTIIVLNGSVWNLFTKINLGGMNTVNTTATDTINATLYSVSANNATSAWAVGGRGTVLYWGGTEWDGQGNITTADLKGVSMIHGNFSGFGQAWAVGTGGKILAWAGNVWVPEFPMLAIPVLLSLGFVIILLAKLRLFRKPPIV